MDTKAATIQLVKDLMQSEKGLLPYTLYQRYGVTPVALVRIVRNMQNIGYLSLVDDNRIILTSEGKSNAEGYINSLAKQTKNKVDSDYFKKIKGNHLDKRKPYLPSRQFFEQYKKEGEENG